jgi:hypothetical protein
MVVSGMAVSGMRLGLAEATMAFAMRTALKPLRGFSALEAKLPWGWAG